MGCSPFPVSRTEVSLCGASWVLGRGRPGVPLGRLPMDEAREMVVVHSFLSATPHAEEGADSALWLYALGVSPHGEAGMGCSLFPASRTEVSLCGASEVLVRGRPGVPLGRLPHGEAGEMVTVHSFLSAMPHCEAGSDSVLWLYALGVSPHG